MKATQTNQKVRLNENVAPAFAGLLGAVIGTRVSVINGELFDVKLDTPTPPAKNWPVIYTLAVSRNCFSEE